MADAGGGRDAERSAPETKPEPEWTDHVLQVPSCPPAEASPTNGPVYRRVGPEGLKTWAELRRGKPKLDLERCQYAAFSVFTDLDSLRAAANVHGYMAAQPVIVAQLTPEHGLIARTGRTPGHHSLWLRKKHMDAREGLFKALP
jgi:hypothetical protein